MTRLPPCFTFHRILFSGAAFFLSAFLYSFAFVQSAQAIQFAYGTYTGNGVDGRQITGVGFQPGVVIIKASTSQDTRYYNAEVQRFVSEDTIGFRGGDYNLYNYVGNNPLIQTDPSGKCPQCLVAAGALALLEKAFVISATISTAIVSYLWCREKLKDRETDCKKEMEACLELCSDAYADPDRQHIYGGNMRQCIKNCLPEECGGEPKWKGYKR